MLGRQTSRVLGALAFLALLAGATVIVALTIRQELRGIDVMFPQIAGGAITPAMVAAAVGIGIGGILTFAVLVALVGFTRWRVGSGATVPLIGSLLTVPVSGSRATPAGVEYDRLTGLLDRQSFTEQLGFAIQNAVGWWVGVVVIDIDEFRFLNESVGYPIGDLVLQALSDQIVRAGGSEVIACRFSGDSFAVLIRQINADADIIALAERLASAVAAPLHRGENLLYLTATIGMTTSQRSAGGATAMLRDAELAIATAKAGGRGQILMFDPAMRQQVDGQLELAHDLRQALSVGELTLHYQPIFNLETGAPQALEALVRWQHPKRGLVLPREFIPVAEAVGLVVPLGRWVLLEACRTAAGWAANGSGRAPAIHVNVTAAQVRGPFFVREVAEALVSSGLAPERLVLELSGRFTIENIDDSTTKLTALRRLGVRVAVDRFDLQSVPLDRLSRLPLDTIKIAPSLFESPDVEAASRAITETVLQAIRALRIAAIAIDIETAEQFGHAIEMGCAAGQGSWFGEPATLSQFQHLVGVEDAEAEPISREQRDFPSIAA